MLVEAGKFKELAIHTQHLIEAMPGDAGIVADLQAYRARAFLYEGGKEKALFSAKGMYNVCPMDRMDEATSLVVECLHDARAHGEDVGERFKAEQVRDADLQNVTNTAPRKSTVLQSIHIDRKQLPQTYDRALERIAGDDFKSLMGRGNLYLLADRISDARNCFQRAYQIADEKNLAQATEGLARVMKAEDGATGRAAAWLAAQHPSTTAPAASK